MQHTTLMYKSDKKNKLQKKQLFKKNKQQKKPHQIWNVTHGILGMSIYGYSL